MPKLLTPDEANSHEKFLLYGEPKTGKTFAALTAPDPIYAISVGNIDELTTAFGKDFKDKYPSKIIYHDVAEESFGVRGNFDAAVGFDAVCDLLDTALAMDADPEDPFTFSTLVIDNATVLNNFAMFKSMEINYDDANMKSNTALHRLREANIVIPGDNDYMSQMSLMMQFVQWLFRLNKHVVLIAHEWKEEHTDRKTKTKTINAVKPLFTGKHRTDVPGLFSNVWRFQRQGQFFEALTMPKEKPYDIIAGTRIGGVLRSPYRDVNLTEAIAALQKEARRTP